MPPVPQARRIVVVGTTGSGKTTAARRLSQVYGIPHIELDAINWGPNWTSPTRAVFRAQVAAAVAPDAWVTEGNYRSVRDLVWSRATDLVWLDYPLRTVLWQLLQRTLRRGLRREVLWNGNREPLLRHFVTRESLFLWALQSHARHQEEYEALTAEPEYRHLRVIRFRSPGDTREWLTTLGTAGAQAGKQERSTSAG